MLCGIQDCGRIGSQTADVVRGVAGDGVTIATLTRDTNDAAVQSALLARDATVAEAAAATYRDLFRSGQHFY
jgi:hypothetical protein